MIDFTLEFHTQSQTLSYGVRTDQSSVLNEENQKENSKTSIISPQYLQY